MLMIRLQRVGKKNEPTFRIVVTDSKNSTKSGRFLEVIGSYDSREKNETKVDADRVKHWMGNGAQLSDTLHNLFITMGVIEGKKINVLPKKSPIVKEVEEGAEKAKPEAVAPAEGDDAAAPATDAEAPAEEVAAPAEETPAVEEASKEESVEPTAEVAEEVASEAPVAEEVAPETTAEEKPTE